MNDYPDDFVSIQLHIGDAYETDWTRRRANFYGVTGTPTTWFDGVIEHVGAATNDNYMYNWYLGSINARLAVPTDVTIELSAEEVAAQTYEISATVSIEAGGQGKDMTVHVIQVLDYYPTSADNRYRNCVMQNMGLTIITVDPGQSETVVGEVTLDGVNWTRKEDVKIVCWARETGSPAPKEIFNTTQLAWPLVQVEGDLDGDGDVDLTDLAILLAAYGTCDGDPAHNPDADIDGDRCVGLSDLAILLANYGR